MQLSQRITGHRDEILALARKHGAENVRVFGSFSNGTATAASDLDLLVTLGIKQTPFFPGGLKADLEILLECKVDIVLEGGLHSLIREQILKEAIEL